MATPALSSERAAREAEIERLCNELICAEDCPEHRAVAVIRDEIHVLRQRDAHLE